MEGILAQVARLHARAKEALTNRDLPRARSALEDASAVLPSDPGTSALQDELDSEALKLDEQLEARINTIMAFQ